jgi:hypothetical protein
VVSNLLAASQDFDQAAMNSVVRLQDIHRDCLKNQPCTHSGEPVSPETHDAAHLITYLGLKICSGRTGYPERPIWCDRFLIGSDESCDLRLGGDGIPLLHSLIHFDGEEYRIETVLANPPLFINGCERSSAVIAEGDEIQLGEFSFTVCRIAPSDSIANALDVSADLSDAFDGAVDEEAIPNLSASELADRLEQELAAVESFETGRERGAEALLDAITERAIPSEQSSSLADNEIGHVIGSLDQLVERLERRSSRLAEREESLAQAATQLLELQHQLSEQMGVLLDRLENMRHEEESQLLGPRRAIA